MGPLIARIIGSAGSGKTTRLLEIMSKLIESGFVSDPSEIMFCSFTKAARTVAAERAAERFNVPIKSLTEDGWFRTIHSIAYKQLGIGKELLADSKADRKWIEEAIQHSVKGGQNSDESIAGRTGFEESGSADIALSIWDCCRNRLCSYEAEWQRRSICDDRIPKFDVCRTIIERYETAKRVDHRVDFVDILGIFAGWSFHFDSHLRCEPQGDTVLCKVVFVDEVQDHTPLIWAVQERLIKHATYVYLAGDPFQSLYNTWAGADHRLFLDCPVAKKETMPVSHRCARKILALGELILRDCSDYFDRGVTPRDEEGLIERELFRNELADIIKHPGESWLLLARSNFHAAKLARILDNRGIPWSPTRGNGGWNAPKRNAATATLMAMQAGKPVDGREWLTALDYLPSKLNKKEPLLRSGTKAQFERMEDEQLDDLSFVMPNEWESLGVTPLLADMIRDGSWKGLVEKARQYTSAVDRWGQEVVDNPKIFVSTIHAAKGMEAESVILLTSTSRQCARSMETQEGRDEEARIRYVAVTRARRRLVIARERTDYAMEIPVLTSTG